MNFMLIISFFAFLYPIGMFIYELFRYYTYVKIELPCGSFKIKRIFNYDINVMTRIVSKEFFSGGEVDSEVMEVLYMKYGPLSWQSKNIKQAAWKGGVLWILRIIRSKTWYKSPYIK